MSGLQTFATMLFWLNWRLYPQHPAQHGGRPYPLPPCSDRPIYYENMGAVDMRRMLRIASRKEVEEVCTIPKHHG